MDTQGGPKGRRDRRSISCPVHGACSLVKHRVAFGIYRASSHLGLICLFAAGSCPGGVKPRGEFAGGMKEGTVSVESYQKYRLLSWFL